MSPDTERVPPAENGSQTRTVQEIMAEHRQCGPGFDGCYSHWPTPHCRADGMAWPCDVDAIRAAIGPHTHPPGQTDKRCAECYRAGAQAGPPSLSDPYDMRVMVRALYGSGLTNHMEPPERRKAALALREQMQTWAARLGAEPESDR